MRFHMVRPRDSLGEYIQYYCFMESDPHESQVVERVIPTESVQLLLHYRNPFLVCGPEQRSEPQPRSFVSGLCDSFSDVATSGEVGVVFVAFRPVGACSFFRFPLGDLENRNVDLGELFGRELRELEEGLSQTTSVALRVAALEKFLAALFSPLPDYDRRVMKAAVGLIRSAGGQMCTRHVAERLSLTPKTLERKFAEYIGVTPKRYSKLIRFRRALRLLDSKAGAKLTECAYCTGYFDQSHFIKDFKAYTGYTPREFLLRYPAAAAEEAVAESRFR